MACNMLCSFSILFPFQKQIITLLYKRNMNFLPLTYKYLYFCLILRLTLYASDYCTKTSSCSHTSA